MISLVVFVITTTLSGVFMYVFLQPLSQRQRIAVPVISTIMGFTSVALMAAYGVPIDDTTAVWVVGTFSLPYLGIGVFQIITAHDMAGVEGLDIGIHTEAIQRHRARFTADNNGERADHREYSSRNITKTEL